MVNVAGQHAMFGSTGDTDAHATHVAHLALSDLAVHPVRHLDPVVQAGFGDKTGESDMGGVSKRDEGGIECGERDLCSLQIARRPQVKAARSTVDDELARLIKFL
jgi:hypothetical protein